MRIRPLPSLALVLVLILASLLAAGCGGGNDEVAEREAERAIEDASGEDVDVQVDGDDVTIEGGDGDSSFSTSDDLPDDWPSDIEMPDGTDLQGSSSIGSGDAAQLTTSGTLDAEIADVVSHFEGEFDGWKTEGTADIGEGDAAVANRSWSKDGRTATLTVSRMDGDTTFVVGINGAG